MNLTERLQEAFDKRVCGTAMLPASDLLSAMTAIEQAEAENAALKEQCAQQAEAIRLKDEALLNLLSVIDSEAYPTIQNNGYDAVARQPSPNILQARDDRVAEAITKYLRAVGVLSYEGTALQGIISGEWRKYL